MLKTLTLPLILTLLMHGLLVTALLIDWSGERTVIKRQTPQYINATLVKLDKPKAKPKRKPKPKAKPIPKPKPIIPKKPAPQKELKPKTDSTVLQKAEAQRLLEEQRLQDQKQKLLESAAMDFDEAIEDESEAREAQTDAELANSHIALITQAIVRNWSRPASARNNMEAELVLDLVPTGEVINVSVVKSSGNVAFDRSAVAAVKRAKQFSALQQLPNHVFQQYFRRLRMKFKPEDLRR